MTCNLDHDAPASARHTRPLWFHVLCSIGWGFLCLHWFALRTHAWSTNEYRSDLFEFFGLLAAPPAVLLSALLYSRSRARWWWSVAAVVVAAAAVAAGFWLWHSPGHVRLRNTLYYVAPTAFVLSWCSVGLLLGSIFDRLLARTGRAGMYATAVFALAAGAFGLLHLLLPDMPGLSDHLAFLFCPLVVVASASFYGVMWVGVLRSGQRGRGGARLTDSDQGP